MKRRSCEATVLVDDERVRVTRFDFAPGAETGWHRHEHDYVITAITDCPMLLEEPDGGKRRVLVPAGTAYRRQEGLEHNVVNDSAQPMRFVEVELKQKMETTDPATQLMTRDKDLSEAIIGTWELIDRIDRVAEGSLRSEPNLGSDPLAMLTYTRTRFAAQFMRREREAGGTAAVLSGSNNTTAVGGYDAYFGTYQIAENGEVLHRLMAALTPANVDMEVWRFLAVDGNQLTIRLQTATADGEPVTRTLTWRRLH